MTTTITEPQLAHTVERYVRFWNSTPEQQRRRGHETFAEDVTYAAPAGLLTGVGALADFTEQFLGEAGAGYEYRARTAPDLHHGNAGCSGSCWWATSRSRRGRTYWCSAATAG